MTRIIVGAIAWFGFGIILAEVLNNFELVKLRIDPASFAGFLSAVFLMFKLSLRYYEKKSGLSHADKKKFKKIFRIYEVLIMLIGILLFILIPFLWFGVIKRLAMIANESGGGL